MINTKTWLALSAAAACIPLTGSLAFAQKPGDTKPTQPMSTQAKDLKGCPSVFLSSDVLGTKVVSPQGESLGKIDDVVLSSNGEIAYAVLSFGGVMGLGDKLFAIPWHVLETKAADAKAKSETKIVLPLEKERLKNAPGFDKAHWPSMVSPDWSKDIDAYYANYRRADAPKPLEASARTGEYVWRASDLKGFDVETPTGEKLGDIEDLAFDTSGRVCYAVISVGGFLGIGDRDVAVPWGALHATRLAADDKRTITLATTKESLKQAPEFVKSKEKRADMCDPVWIGRVYDFYQVRPYWTTNDNDDMSRPKNMHPGQ